MDEIKELTEKDLRIIVSELCRFYDCCNWKRDCFHPQTHGEFGKCDSVTRAENILNKLFAAGYRKSVPSEKLVEEIALYLYKNVFLEPDENGQPIEWDSASDFTQKECLNHARSLASLLPEKKLKLIDDEKQMELVVRLDVSLADIRAIARTQLAADRKE